MGLHLGPAAFGFALALGAGRWSRSVVRIADLLLLACVAMAAFDLPAQVIIGALGTETSFMVKLIVATSVLAWTVLLRSLARHHLGPGGPESGIIRSAAVAIILAVSLWSLVVMAVAAGSAIAHADGRPYCIAVSGGPRDHEPIRSVFRLRGTHFYTEHTGYKDTSRWFFNGILVVGDEKGKEYYNWSYRNWGFQRLRTDRFIAGIQGACQPRAAFLTAPWRGHHEAAGCGLIRCGTPGTGT